MREKINFLYDFEPFRVDPLRRKLLCRGLDLQIKSKAFDTLLFLIERRGAVVSKEELMSAVWPDTAVEDNNLTQQISALRRKFSEYAGETGQEFIVTMPKQGYKFTPPVRQVREIEDEILVREVTSSSITIDIGRADDRRTEPRRRKTFALAAAFSGAPAREIFLGCVLMAIVVFVSIYLEEHKALAAAPELPRSIAVLDFEALDNNERSSFYSTGITRTLTAKIGNLETMILRPSGSGGQYFGQERDVVAAGRRLRADVVLEGSVQNDGQRVRVTVVAWDLKANRQLWGDVFTRDASNAFGLQDEISEEIISAVQAKLLN